MKHLLAFTLIELLVSLGIIVAVLAMSLPAFSRFQRNQELINSASTIRDAVLDASNFALSPRDGPGEQGKASGADYYRVVLFTDNKQAHYRVEEQTFSPSGLLNTNAFLWKSVREGVLPKAVSYCKFAPPTLEGENATAGITYSISQLGRAVNLHSFTFDEFKEQKKPPADTDSYQVILKHMASGDAKLVSVNAVTGQVEISNGNRNCS